MRRHHILSSIALALLVSATAQAQFFTPIRYNEGPGVKLTDSLVFHPGVAIETRYDNNPLATDIETQGAAYMRLIAHIDLATLSPQRLTDGSGNVARQAFEFRLKSAVAYREYFSGEDAVVEQRALEVDAGALVKYAPSRMFAIQVTDDFARQVTARNFQVVAAGGSVVLPSQTLSRDLNRLAAAIKLSPGGGRLAIDVGYALNLDAFEDDGFRRNNKVSHEVFLHGSYKLLPKTAVLLEVVQQFYDYYNVGAGPRTALDNNNSKPLRLYAGFSGLITPKFSVLAKVGYGNSFYAASSDFNSVLAKAELGYQIGPMARVKAGYERRFDDSVFGNFFADHIVYAGYDHQVGQRFLLHLVADYRRRAYEGFAQASGASALDMDLATIGAGFDYQIQEWIYVGVGYDLQLQDLTTGGTSAAFAQTVAGLTDFARHQVFGRVGVSY